VKKSKEELLIRYLDRYFNECSHQKHMLEQIGKWINSKELQRITMSYYYDEFLDHMGDTSLLESLNKVLTKKNIKKYSWKA
jgi:hypothetical protein